jgi:hypothetical protein
VHHAQQHPLHLLLAGIVSARPRIGHAARPRSVSSRGIGGSGHGHNSILKPAGGSAQSQQIEFHHPQGLRRPLYLMSEVPLYS